MAVKNLADESTDANYLETLRDEEFIGELEEMADRVQFNDKTGHIIAVFRCSADETNTVSHKVFDLARTYAYDVVRLNDNKHSTAVILG